ncbi:MAG: lytic murein transglycosylase [Pseudomonadota bacterium]
MKKCNSVVTAAALLICSAIGPSQAESFGAYVKGLRGVALQAGIAPSTYDRAMKGVRADTRIDRFTRKQPELVKPIGGYITQRTKGALAKRGRGKVKPIGRTLNAIGKRYGVDPYVVAAIWGMESGYGAGIGTSNVFRTLATLGWKRYRGDLFQNELLNALVIMERERMKPSQMVSSWAGAMGQTQFIPSSFRKFAVDHNGDGKRDLWSNVGDALGSTANYLKSKGWVPDQPWGYAVRLPKSVARDAVTQDWAAWTRAGVKARNGKAFPKRGQATLFFPAGAEGPAFLISPNYEVIRDYNSSDAYSLSVGLLADQLRGGRYIPMDWPTAKTLNKAQRMEVQKRLADKGYDVPNRTGRIIKGVRKAVRDFQAKIGVTPDGYPDVELIRQLRR